MLRERNSGRWNLCVHEWRSDSGGDLQFCEALCIRYWRIGGRVMSKIGQKCYIIMNGAEENFEDLWKAFMEKNVNLNC